MFHHLLKYILIDTFIVDIIGGLMGKGKLFLIIDLFLVMLVLPFSSIAQENTRVVWSFEGGGIDVKIYAPYQAYPGDVIKIRVRVEALEGLYGVYVTVRIYGSEREGYSIWHTSISVLNGVDLSSGVVKDETYDREIPSDSDPGLVYGRAFGSWIVSRLPPSAHSFDDSFNMVYLKNRAYEDLQVTYISLLNEHDSLLDAYNELKSDYDKVKAELEYWKAEHISLKSDYDSLQAAYDSLKTDHDSLKRSYDLLKSDHDSLQTAYTELKSKYQTSVSELGIYKNLSYLLIIAVIVFAAATVYKTVYKEEAHRSPRNSGGLG